MSADDLLTRASLVGDAPAATSGEYWWSSAQDVVLLRPGSTRIPFRLSQLNAVTGLETPLKAFNRKFGSRIFGDKWRISTHGVPGFEIAYSPPRCSLSPDGKWFLWLRRGPDSPGAWVAASLDATVQREWIEQHSIPSDCCWFRDSPKWVQVVSEYRKQTYTIKRLIVRSVVPRSASRTTAVRTPAGLVLGVTLRDSVLLNHRNRKNPEPRISLSEVSLTHGRPVRRHSIPLVQPGQISDLALSRAGDRLAWFFTPGGQFDSQKYFLCVSEVDGKKTRKVGSIRGILELPEGGSGKRRFHWPQSLAWLPDGNEISFVFKERLYRLPVM